jgi:hypothetical protein
MSLDRVYFGLERDEYRVLEASVRHRRHRRDVGADDRQCAAEKLEAIVVAEARAVIDGRAMDEL